MIFNVSGRLLKYSGLILGALVVSLAGVEGAVSQDRDQTAIGRRIIATASLAAKEYAVGVIGGMVVSSAEVEEAELFLDGARQNAFVLDASVQARAVLLIDSMKVLVQATEDPDEIFALVDELTAEIEAVVGDISEVPPATRFNERLGRSVYAENCESCHGDYGDGRGSLAGSLDPAPTDFTDAVFLKDQTPLDFYRKVGLGVAGTAMPSYENSLTDEERWAVAWYSTQFRSRNSEVVLGSTVAALRCDECGGPVPALSLVPRELADPEIQATLTDEELFDAAVQWGVEEHQARSTVAFFRTLPFGEEPRDGVLGAFADTRVELARSLREAKDGDSLAGAAHALDAYAKFEMVEPDVRLRDFQLANALEVNFAELRGRMERGDDFWLLMETYGVLDDRLSLAEDLLQDEGSTAGLFAQSFILLLREGMEALLIVGALVTLVVRAGASGRRKEIWGGVGLALVASGVTAFLIEAVFHLGSAQREALEGITMLVATAVLVLVGHWLISKVESTRWQHFVSSQVKTALTGGSIFTLGFAAFLAVYREGVETILFYKALMISSEGAGSYAILGGGLAAFGVLCILYFAIERFGLRIPLRPFFAGTSVVLLYMAFSFAGKGIAELQESDLVATTVLDWAPSVPWVGIYPTAQSLIMQGIVLSLLAGGLAWTFVFQPRLARAVAA
ncbi:MAG: FTR1 family protein [Gemmatimonadota bacterium]|nr:FTR1 family protein [Gemmatimonadota bacterium]